MPILKTRYDYSKVFRPNGSRYAHGGTCFYLPDAVQKAVEAFEREFGPEAPLVQESAVVEIIGVTAGWSATIFEILEQME